MGTYTVFDFAHTQVSTKNWHWRESAPLLPYYIIIMMGYCLFIYHRSTTKKK